MKIDYLKFVRWSGKDKVYSELCELVDEDVAQRRRAKQPLPPNETIVAMPVAA